MTKCSDDDNVDGTDEDYSLVLSNVIGQSISLSLSLSLYIYIYTYIIVYYMIV